MGKRSVRICWEKAKSGCLSSSCTMVCVKVFLIISNLAFMVSGWVILGVSVWLHAKEQDLLFVNILSGTTDTTDTALPLGHSAALSTQASPALPAPQATEPVSAAAANRNLLNVIVLSLLAVSLGIIVISFLGCCGAYTDSICFICFYCVLILIALVALLFVSGLIDKIKEQVFSSLVSAMRDQIRYGYNATHHKLGASEIQYSAALTKAWDRIQLSFSCCGSEGPKDYHDSYWFNHTQFAEGPFVPLSCCVMLEERTLEGGFNWRVKDEVQCQIEAILNMNHTIQADNLHVKGCQTVFRGHLNRFDYSNSFLTTLIIAQILEFLHTILFLVSLRRQSTEYAFCVEDDC